MPPTKEMRDWLASIPGATELARLLSADGSDAKPSDEIAGVMNTSKVSAAPAPGVSADAPLKEQRKSWEKRVKDAEKEVEEVQEALKDLEKDPVKFARAKMKHGVPSPYEQYEKDTPETRLLDDLKTGTEKAQEYIQYINDAAEYVQEFGDITQLEKAKKVAERLQGIAKKVGGPLKKVQDGIDKAKKIITWYEAASDFADATRKLEFKGTRISRDSVKKWVDSIKGLASASEPFGNWVADKATGAASAVLSIVGAQLKVGLAALDAGVKVVSAYLNRYEDIMKQIDEAANGRKTPGQVPKEPAAWQSREERAGAARAWEIMELTRKAAEERDYAKRQAKETRDKEIKQARAAYDRQHQKFIDEFEAKLFPAIYLRQRPEMRKKLEKLVRQQRESVKITDQRGPVDLSKLDSKTPADRWWNCLTADNRPVDAGWPTKAKVTLKEAEHEISEFKIVKPPFPDFDKLRQTSLDQHLAKVATPFVPPPE